MELGKHVEEKRESLINALIQKNVYKGSHERQLYDLTLTELEDLHRRAQEGDLFGLEVGMKIEMCSVNSCGVKKQVEDVKEHIFQALKSVKPIK